MLSLLMPSAGSGKLLSGQSAQGTSVIEQYFILSWRSKLKSFVARRDHMPFLGILDSTLITIHVAYIQFLKSLNWFLRIVLKLKALAY